MTPIEQVLAARDSSFLQVYVSEKGMVGVSLMDGGHEVVRYEKETLGDALGVLNTWLSAAMVDAAACAFWDHGRTEKKRSKAAERQRAYRERKKGKTLVEVFSKEKVPMKPHERLVRKERE